MAGASPSESRRLPGVLPKRATRSDNGRSARGQNLPLRRALPVLGSFAVAAVADHATAQQYSSWFGSGAIAVSIPAALPRSRRFLTAAASMAAVWGAFVVLRGAADTVGAGLASEQAMGRLESRVLRVASLSAWLQDLAGGTAIGRAADPLLTMVYASFFIAPIVGSLVAYTQGEVAFRRFLRATGITLAISGLGFVVLPTAPPWMTDEANVERIAQRVLGLDGSGGDSSWSFEPNSIAAFPSVHVAAAALTALVIAGRNRRNRIVGQAYPAAMSMAVVYLGEHFAVDALAGWGLALVAWAVSDFRGANAGPSPGTIPGAGAGPNRIHSVRTPEGTTVLWPISTMRSPEGSLSIGGCLVTDLAAEFGTPLYIFDQATLMDRAVRVTTAFRTRYERSEVVYGGKAYLSPTIIRLFHQRGIGLDVVSGGEIFGGLRAGVPAERMVFHGNNKTEAELRMALEAGVGVIVLDNQEEIVRLERLADELYGQGVANGTKVPVMLRLNPGVDVHTHAKISTGVVDSKFGFPVWEANASEAVDLLATCRRLTLVGLHMHLGSQISEHDALPVAIERQVAFAADVRARHGIAIERYSPGGGLSIAYTEAGVDSDPEQWAVTIVDAYRAAWEKHDLPDGQIVAEPGRWLIGPAGVALYSVGSVKRIPGVRTYVAVDGGMADNLRPALYDAVYTAAIANRRADGPVESVRIAGRFCESGDVLIQDVALAGVQVDDLIAVPASGAYQLPMASNYNAVPRPAVVMVGDGRAQVIRRRETYEDVFRCEVFD